MALLAARTRQQAHPELVQVRDREHLWVTGRTLHRALDAHLPDDEPVRELAVGAHDGARALLAVTDHRAVLAHDPRTGGACVQVPLEQLVAVEWRRHGPTGTLALRSATSVLLLQHVELRHGPWVADRLRALVSAARRQRVAP